MPGDRVTAIDGTRITDFEQMPEIIAVSGGHTLNIDLVRADQPLSIHVMPHAARMRDILGDMGTNVVIGVRPSRNAHRSRRILQPAWRFCGGLR